MKPPCSCHVAGDQLGGPAGVELVGAARGDPVERGGQVGLDEPVAALPGGAVGLAERGDRLGKVAQPAEVVAPARVWRRLAALDALAAASWRLSEPARSAEIGKPSRASRAAGRTSSAQGVLPKRAWASPRPRTVPGTPAAQAPAR